MNVNNNMDKYNEIVFTILVFISVLQGAISDCDEEPPSVDNMDDVLDYLDFTVDCDTWVVYVNISSCKLENLGLTDVDHIFVDDDEDSVISDLDDACQFTLDSDNDVYYAIFDWDECSPNIEETDEFIRTFEYILNMKLGNWDGDAAIKRDFTSSVSITCSYDVAADSTVDEIDPEQVSYELAEQISTGSYKVRMRAFADSSLTDRLTSGYRLVTVPEFFYVKMVIRNAGVGMILQAEECWATATSDSSDTDRLDIIVGGCPDTTLFDDDGVTVLENYASDTVVFGVRSFLWTGFAVSGQEIYIHCMLAFCDSTAQTDCTTDDCSNRRKRSISIIGLQSKEEKHKQKKRINSTLSSISPIAIKDDSICSVESVQCQQICTVINASRACRCFSNYQLLDDGITCQIKDIEKVATSSEIQKENIPSVIRTWKMVIENSENLDIESLKMTAAIVGMFAVFIVLFYVICRYCRYVRASDLENLGYLPHEKRPLRENA